mgnify:CR=1 FL=1
MKARRSASLQSLSIFYHRINCHDALKKFHHSPTQKRSLKLSQMLARIRRQRHVSTPAARSFCSAMKHDLLRYEHLVDVKTISDLNKIEIEERLAHDRQHASPTAPSSGHSVRQRKLAGSSPRWKPKSPTCACARAALWGQPLLLPSRTPIRRRCYVALGAKAQCARKVRRENSSNRQADHRRVRNFARRR